MTKVKLKEDANIVELAEILVNLRIATDQWQVGYGAALKDRKKLWEEKADQWINKNLTKL